MIHHVGIILFNVGLMLMIIGFVGVAWVMLRRRFSAQSRLLFLAIVTALMASGLFVFLRISIRIG